MQPICSQKAEDHPDESISCLDSIVHMILSPPKFILISLFSVQSKAVSIGNQEPFFPALMPPRTAPTSTCKVSLNEIADIHVFVNRQSHARSIANLTLKHETGSQDNAASNR